MKISVHAIFIAAALILFAAFAASMAEAIPVSAEAADNTSLIFLHNWGHSGSGHSCTNSCGPCVWFPSLKG